MSVGIDYYKQLLNVGSKRLLSLICVDDAVLEDGEKLLQTRKVNLILSVRGRN